MPNAVRTQITSFNTGGTVAYQCNTGFSLQGLTTITTTISCQTNGKWTSKPVCVPLLFTGNNIQLMRSIKQNFFLLAAYLDLP